MTLTTGSSNPQETETVNFFYSNARASCEFSNLSQIGNDWTATIKVTNLGYNPNATNSTNLMPTPIASPVYKGKNWGVTLTWYEDYPGTGARAIARNISSTDGKARVSTHLTKDGNNVDWYTYFFAAPDFVGEIAGRAANGTPASYSFNIRGTGTFLLSEGKTPELGCSFGQSPAL
jgi:hypothetical protein